MRRFVNDLDPVCCRGQVVGLRWPVGSQVPMTGRIWQDFPGWRIARRQNVFTTLGDSSFKGFLRVGWATYIGMNIAVLIAIPTAPAGQP